MATPHQQGLFGPIDEPDGAAVPRVEPAPASDDLRALAARLPGELRLGTSSWSFAGWQGLVYAQGTRPKDLARHGLSAYARHPLLRSVSVDRTFYAPVTTGDFAEWATAVPEDFRFVVKAFAECTSPVVRGKRGRNARYLDVDAAVDLCIAPAVEGLGDKLGAIVFQFPPQGVAVTRAPAAFADRLGAFLQALPRGVRYAVELRDEALLGADYARALTQGGAEHCFSVHPRMPALDEQLAAAPPRAFAVVRWMLLPGRGYEAARAEFEPFDRLAVPDPDRRGAIARLCLGALARGLPVTIVVNNKAEGSAPLSVLELARAIGAAPGGT